MYLAQVLRNGEKNYLPLMVRLIKNPDVLERVPSRILRAMSEWALENILAEGILTVENWLEVAFHLCKQRWDSSIDWLEGQPMSKIKLMMDINRKFAQQQEDEMKKSSRRRR